MGRRIRLRGARWHYCRRVPTDLVPALGRTHERISLNTTDEAVALQKAAELDAEIEADWQARRGGDFATATAHRDAVGKMAERFQVQLRTGVDLAKNAPLEEIAKRVALLMQLTPPGQEPARDVEAALLGDYDEPTLLASQVAEVFFSLTPDRIIGKNERQKANWFNGRRKACREFCEGIGGDKPIKDLTAADFVTYRNYIWSKTWPAGGVLKVDTANKQFQNLLPMLYEVAQKHGVKLPDRPKLAFRVPERELGEGGGAPIPHEELLRIFADCAFLESLQPSQRRIFFMVCFTGARPSEIAGLEACDIHLASNTPYIDLRSNDLRKLKNRFSARKIPLTGPALEIMRLQPEGFPDLAGKDATANLKKRFRGAGYLAAPLVPYSARHSFSDYIRDLTSDPELRCALMGHAYKAEEKYGGGHSMEARRDILARLPIPSPATL